MWNWFNCYLSGRHEFGVWCEPGTVFLRCMHCGRRSSGWAVNDRTQRTTSPAGKTPPLVRTGQVVPFTRSATG
jgi:hypothetical protein